MFQMIDVTADLSATSIARGYGKKRPGFRCCRLTRCAQLVDVHLENSKIDSSPDHG